MHKMSLHSRLHGVRGLRKAGVRNIARVNSTAGRGGPSSNARRKSQAFLWTRSPAALALRRPGNWCAGHVFQSRSNVQSVRLTIVTRSPGPSRSPGRSAQASRPLDQGATRGSKGRHGAKEIAERDAKKAARPRIGVTGLDAWAVYLEDRRASWNRAHIPRPSGALQQPAGETSASRLHPRPCPDRFTHCFPMPLAPSTGEAVHAWVTAR